MAEGLAQGTVRHGHGSMGWTRVSKWLGRYTMMRWVVLYEIRNKLIFFLQDMQHVDGLARLSLVQRGAKDAQATLGCFRRERKFCLWLGFRFQCLKVEKKRDKVQDPYEE